MAFSGRSVSVSALSSVSSSRQAACSNFADLRCSGEHFFEYRILLFTIVCDIAASLELVAVAGSCLAF